MNSKNRLYLLGLLLFSFVTVAVIISLQVFRKTRDTGQRIDQAVLGKLTDTLPIPQDAPGQTHVVSMIPPTSTPSVAVPTKESPPVTNYAVVLIAAPSEITQGDTATFTWELRGSSNTIKTTTVYYGTTSSPGTFATSVAPTDTRYTDWIKDFMDGSYNIPLRFVGNTTILTPGTYFFRAYARIDGKHYWSSERTFVVKQIPRHEIKIISYPSTLSPGGNATFTWEILGPSATTGFTTIAGGTQSKPGTLDTSVDLPNTPYSVMLDDFTSGTYAVPLRFIGNTRITDPGVYYFRVLAFINGKNIWSDEYSFTVQ